MCVAIFNYISYCVACGKNTTLHFITAIRRATVYKCKKCRMALATTENILPHWTTVTSGELELITWPKMLTKLLQTETAEDSQKIIFSKENNCKGGLFLEPLQWMNVCHAAVSENQTLQCSKCHTKLGSFSWGSSIKCGCGAAMAPAFFVHLSKVDKCTMHKEIEAVI